MPALHSRRPAAVLLVPVLLGLSCGVEDRISDLLHSDSPYEEYLGRLRESGLDQTALGRDWVRAGETALAAAAAARTPFLETGYFPPETPGAVAWRLELRRGRTLAIELRFDTARPARVFLDLFSVRDSNPPSRVASLKEDSTALRYQVRRDGVYILRLQPELLRGGRWTLVQRTEASLGFPVPGLDVKAVKSRFGVDRDAGRRRHHGLDIFAPRGTAVVALVDGYARPGTNELGGNVVWLTDGRRNLYYAHLDRWALEGDAQVRVGDTLGYIGNTGNARTTPPHLHFGIYDNGPVDPFPFLAPDDPSPPAPSQPPEEWNEWVRVTARGAVLRSGASRDADTVLRIERGGLARVIAASQNALRVLLPDESTGYVDASAMTDTERALTRIELDSGTVLRESPAESAPAVAVLSVKTSVDVLGGFAGFSLVRLPDAALAWRALPSKVGQGREAPQGWPRVTTEYPELDSTRLIRKPGTNVVMFRTAATLEFIEGISDAAKRRFFARNNMTVLGEALEGVFFVRIPDPGNSIARFDAYFDSLKSKPGILRALPAFRSGITPINNARPARRPLT